MHYWLMKSEGESYSVDDLAREGVTPWEGVRNYQARNYMVRDMQVGDGVLFYHSGKTPGIYGVAKVATKAHLDLSQFNAKESHFDPKATKDKPIWFCVDVAFVKKFKNPVPLGVLKADKQLEGMVVRRPGSRLSVQPVSQKHFEQVCSLAR